jgi:hypothetical protein
MADGNSEEELRRLLQERERQLQQERQQHEQQRQQHEQEQERQQHEQELRQLIARQDAEIANIRRQIDQQPNQVLLTSLQERLEAAVQLRNSISGMIAPVREVAVAEGRAESDPDERSSMTSSVRRSPVRDQAIHGSRARGAPAGADPESEDAGSSIVFTQSQYDTFLQGSAASAAVSSPGLSESQVSGVLRGSFTTAPVSQAPSETTRNAASALEQDTEH